MGPETKHHLSVGQLLNGIFQVVRQSLAFVFLSLQFVLHFNGLLFLPLELLGRRNVSCL